MGNADGAVLGLTKIVDHGSPADRWNLVITGDGYQQAELATFATDADDVVNALFATPPFNDHMGLFWVPLSDAINVYRMDVRSNQSGADDPAACGGTGAAVATYFDASFCSGGVRRGLAVNSGAVVNEVTALLPNYHAILVIVNSPIYGGTGGQVGVFSKAPSAMEIAIHELGHSAFGLADEYEYYAGCGLEAGHDHHPAVEPGEPNVTIDTNRATIKWGDLIAATTPLPTTDNADCTVCDPQPSPVAPGTVGAFEGAHYYHCDAYRPEFNCKMRMLGVPFCAVCRRVIREALATHLPPPRRWWELQEVDILSKLREIDWVFDPVPFDRVRFRNLARGGPAESPDDLTRVLERLDDLSPDELHLTLLRIRGNLARLEAAERLVTEKLAPRR